MAVARKNDTPASPDPVASYTEPKLTVGQVARLYGVDPKTVTRWVRNGRMPENSWIRTPGGHRRFRESVILQMIDGEHG
jgi:excisionase family DNA binding protein